MDIAIDTNILRQDFKLRDKNFDIFLDYLKKDKSKIILPKVTLEEIKELYKNFLKEKIQSLTSSHNKLSRSLTSHTLKDIDEINIKKELRAYEKFVYKKLNLKPRNIINYKNKFLPELIHRAIEKKKPLGNDGQQFRDGVLWLTLVDYASQQSDKSLIFISNNSKDFSNETKTKLHEQLEAECKKKGVVITYYQSIADFIKEHSSKIDFINKDWIKNNIELTKLEEIFNAESPYVPTTLYPKAMITDYFDYEMTDGKILLNIEVEFRETINKASKHHLIPLDWELPSSSLGSELPSYPLV